MKGGEGGLSSAHEFCMSKQIQYPNDRVDNSGYEWPTIGENIRNISNKVTHVICTITRANDNVIIIIQDSKLKEIIGSTITVAVEVSEGRITISANGGNVYTLIDANIVATSLTNKFLNVTSLTGTTKNILFEDETSLSSETFTMQLYLTLRIN